MTWIVIALIAATIVLPLAFFTCMTIQNALEQGVWVPRWVVVIGKSVYYPGALADIVFNIFVASLLVRELNPHGWTFSNRIQWHVDNPSAKWYSEALLYAKFLNFVRKDHIKRVP